MGDERKDPEEGVGDAENGMRKERRVGGWRGRGREEPRGRGNLGGSAEKDGDEGQDQVNDGGR